jgi:putative peptidoglycan lipid II flippase
MSTGKSLLKDSHSQVAQSAGVIGLATLCSRALGFLRDIVLARLFGVYTYAQAFAVAFKIPNLFRDFIGEGAANAAFVPVFSEYRLKHTKEEFWELANVVLNLLLVAAAAITLLGMLFSPLIVRLIAPGFCADPGKLATTIKLNRIIFPYLLLISLSAYSMGILNSLRHFSMPAFAPCFLNIAIIACTLFFGEGIRGLALGVLLGGCLQLAVQIPVLYKKGFRLKLFTRFRHPAAKTIGKLMLPRMLSSCIYQLNNFVDTIFGSFAWIVGEGGVAVLYFSYHLILFPLGIFSTALSQAILPTFSTQALEENHGRIRETLSFGLRAVFLVLLPASVGFMVLSKQITFTLFGGGKFDAYSANLTASALFFYSFGLCAYGANRILQSCFFALKDTVTPTKIAFLALVLNIVFNSLLMFPLKIAGLALATSISGIISFIVLFIILNKKLGSLDIKAILFAFARILLASLFMGFVCHLAAQNISTTLNKYLVLAILLFIGAVSYIAFCVFFRVSEIRDLWRFIAKHV